MNTRQYNGKLNVIGFKIKYYRQKQGLSLEKLSNKLALIGIDIPKNSLLRLENGKRIIKEYELAALTKILSVSADELLRDFINKLEWKLYK